MFLPTKKSAGALCISIVALTAFSFAVQAGSANLPTHGGNGGDDFSIDCGDDAVLVGVSGRKGSWIDRISARCVKVAMDGKWLGSVFSRGQAGGDGGNSFTFDCPRDSAIGEMGGRYGWYINRLILNCIPASISTNQPAAEPTWNQVSATDSLDVSSSQQGPTAWNTDKCPNSKPGRGFRGRSGNYVDSIGIVCHKGSTPNRTRNDAPDGLAAVNLTTAMGPDTSSTPTPFVQLQWNDRSELETGYRVIAVGTGPRYQIRMHIWRSAAFERPAVSGVDSRQALNVQGLHAGEYRLRVCAEHIPTNGGNKCADGPSFAVSFCRKGPPIITNAERIGAATGEVEWVHSCSNPSRFNVHLQCGNSPFGVVASTFDGSARRETFNIGVGSGRIKVCAIYPGEATTAHCSTAQAFQCN